MLDVLKRSDIAFLEGRALSLLIESYSNATRTLQVRGFTADASIATDHVTNSDRSLATSTVNITSIPVTLTVRASATGVQRGAVYAKVWLRVENTIVGLLGAGYITDTNTIQWPGGLNEGSIEGPGLIRSITGTDPAADTEISETVPTGARWKLLSFQAQLVTDANVATRAVNFVFDDGTNTFGTYPFLTTQSASSTRQYSLGGTIANESWPSTPFAAPIPIDMFLSAAYRIRTSTGGRQTTDNWGAPQLLIEEWIQP